MTGLMGRVDVISITGESFSSESFTRKTVAGGAPDKAGSCDLTSALEAKATERNDSKRLRLKVVLRKTLKTSRLSYRIVSSQCAHLRADYPRCIPSSWQSKFNSDWTFKTCWSSIPKQWRKSPLSHGFGG